MTIGLLHPGEMGAAIGSALVQAGQDVIWVPEGRSVRTARRAAEAGLRPVEGLSELVEVSDIVVSICPPDVAIEVATGVAAAVATNTSWWYLDANTTSPPAMRTIAGIVGEAGGRYVDGRIIGPPPVRPGTTCFYLSGRGAIPVSEVLGSPVFEVHVISENEGDASALRVSPNSPTTFGLGPDSWLLVRSKDG